MFTLTQETERKGTILPDDIDWNEVDRLLKCGCTLQEVCARVGIPRYHMQRMCQKVKGMNFSEYKTEKMDVGNTYLREVQFKLAVKDQDKTMLLWLGRNRLGQSEAPSQESEFNGELKEFVLELREKYKKEDNAGSKPETTESIPGV